MIYFPEETDKNGEETKTEVSGEILEAGNTPKDENNEASKLELIDSTDEKPIDSPTVSLSEAVISNQISII